MASVREMATISARWFIFTLAYVTSSERSANSERFSTTDSVPPKLYSWSPSWSGRYHSHRLPDTNTWMPRNDGRLSDGSGGSPRRGRFRAMPIIGGAIWPPHRVERPYSSEPNRGLSSP